IGANGLAFNSGETALFVANTANDTIVRIPVSGSPLVPGEPEVFVNRVGGGPDGLIIDEYDNLWIACNQSNEIMVLEPIQDRVIAKLGEHVLVTSPSLDASLRSQSLRTVDGPWAAQVKLHTISKIKKYIPNIPR